MAGPDLQPRTSSGGEATQDSEGRWQLTIPEGPGGRYRLAQLDDYTAARRRDALPWTPPVALSLRARVSAPDLPGTWGFGWWNDPFSVQLGFGGSGRRLPALPNAAWFFYASPPNHLAFSGDHPAQGFLGATFAAPRLPFPLLALGMPLLPLLAWPVTARLLRKLIGRIITEDAQALDVDVSSWHTYELAWREDEVRFRIDGETRFTTKVVPRGPLGLVLWIDNQYIAFPPDGRLRFGTAANPEARLVLEEIRVTSRQHGFAKAGP
ncbi:MAG: hypothetical protein ACP5JG_06175 [Anaerolineae bacterium]